MDWFMAGIERGFFLVENPFNRHVSRVPARPADVDTIVFWSKNFGRFLERDYGMRLEERGYHLFFNFTINSRIMALTETSAIAMGSSATTKSGLVIRARAITTRWR